MAHMTVNQRNALERSAYTESAPTTPAERRARIAFSIALLALLAVLTAAAFQVFEGGHHWIVLADLVIVVLGLAAWVNPNRRHI